MQDNLRIEFKEFIKANGYKIGFVSSSLGLAPNSLNCWLNGSFNLSEERQEQLIKFMSKRGEN